MNKKIKVLLSTIAGILLVPLMVWGVTTYSIIHNITGIGTYDGATLSHQVIDISTSNSDLTLGDDGETVTINSSDWDISAIGDMTGIGRITMDGALTLSGTPGNGINAIGTFTDHVIDIQPAASLGDSKAIYVGTWGTEAEFNDGGGLFRIYGKVGEGGTASANIFVRTLTDSTSGPISAQFYTDVDSGTPGPTVVSAVDAFAVLNAGGYLATSVSAVDGMHAVWAKVTADSTSVASGNVYALWVDSQIHCAVAGTEYGIFATTGGSKPDGLIGLNTTSSGYSQFIYADTTFDSGAGTCITTDTVPANAQDARILVWYDGKQYYIPLWR